jgi:hypothetical protein
LIVRGVAAVGIQMLSKRQHAKGLQVRSHSWEKEEVALFTGEHSSQYDSVRKRGRIDCAGLSTTTHSAHEAPRSMLASQHPLPHIQTQITHGLGALVYLGTWVSGFLRTWCLGIWVPGSLGPWVHGYLGAWVLGSPFVASKWPLVVWCIGALVSWRSGAFWPRGSTTLSVVSDPHWTTDSVVRVFYTIHFCFQFTKTLFRLCFSYFFCSKITKNIMLSMLFMLFVVPEHKKPYFVYAFHAFCVPRLRKTLFCICFSCFLCFQITKNLILYMFSCFFN